MTTTVLLIMTLFSSARRTPLLDQYNQASELAQEQRFDQCAEIFREIFERMPDNPRAVYNHAVADFFVGDVHTADSLLSVFPEEVFNEDTLLEAGSSARLGNAMIDENYAGVQGVVEMLLPEISTGEASPRVLQNYEVALKWLMQNEPPPPEDSQDNQDQQDDQNQQNDQDNQDDQDQQDNQDDQDQQDNQDQQEDQDNQPPPPSQPEMTPDVAQMILDMVEEANADTTQNNVGGAIGVPNW